MGVPGSGRREGVDGVERCALTLLHHATFNITFIVAKWIKKGSNMRYPKHKG